MTSEPQNSFTTTGAVLTGYLTGGIRHPAISPEQCVAQGGHCFLRTDTVLASNPPQYPEVCKHCGKRRIGVPREPMTYYDPDEREAERAAKKAAAG